MWTRGIGGGRISGRFVGRGVEGGGIVGRIRILLVNGGISGSTQSVSIRNTALDPIHSRILPSCLWMGLSSIGD